jgi:hypothetical protein
MLPDHEAFLMDQVFSMTLMATAQRGKLYQDGSSEPLREAFRKALRFTLEKLTTQYTSAVSSERHIVNIEALSDELSAFHKDALYHGRFRIGSAQKALNLYLKFMWCLGRIERPPHCPFDFRILSRLPNCETVKWTELDDLSEYRRIVGEAERKAGDLSLAEWELQEYQASK